ncbi:MAG: amidohydrolase [Deltaproteobacteria bacterium]|nr:amidohydrolase [Deltaproteobacteria bacterium]
MDEGAVIRLRRALHACPELAHEEHRTQEILADALGGLGLQARPVAGTGLLAEIGRPEGRTLLLRADMDGLPIDEQTGLGFASQHPGRMHACGHDAHMAMLVGVAARLADRPPSRGRVRIVFQPAEERGEGAQALIRDGVLDAVDGALALHVWSPLPLGQVGVVTGPVMAGVDSFRIRICGRASHAARPEQGVDPILAAASLVMAAQTLVSRRMRPGDRAVCSICRFQAGTASNVIPAQAELSGTLRSFTSEARDGLVRGLQDLLRNISTAMRVEPELEALESIPPTRNDAQAAERARRIVEAIEGLRCTEGFEPLMVGEDFGLLLARVPGAMLLLGCGDPHVQAFPHHHPRFDVDERCLSYGVELLERYARDFLDA